MTLVNRLQWCFQTWFNNGFIWCISFVFIMPCISCSWLPHLSMELVGFSLGLCCPIMLVQFPHPHPYSEWLMISLFTFPIMIYQYIPLPEPVSLDQTCLLNSQCVPAALHLASPLWSLMDTSNQRTQNCSHWLPSKLFLLVGSVGFPL